MKKQYYLWPTIVALALACGIFLGGKLNFNDTPEKLFTTNSKKDKLNRLIDYIDYEYVDDINTDSIVDVTVNNILDKLDPHSVYIPKEDMAQVSENMKGDFVGIGVNFYMYKDTIAVIRAVQNGPSEEKGIKPGDRILMANTDTLYGKRLPSADIVSKLKGKEGTSVKLKIYRKTADKTFDVNIRRDRIPLASVEAQYMLREDIGYIKVNRFAESTYKEFSRALKNLQKKGAEKLVLDLRDNPGGYLGIAQKMADEFLQDGKLILYTKNKKGKVDKTYATKKGNFENKPVYVLINERSASASEIVAGALQDNDIGTIVGRRSFGKGLVQREMELGDGSAVRLTVSRYYTPTGRSIQKSYENGTEDYYERFMNRYENGELMEADSIKVADSLRFETPKGKIVYGGGGIIPDVFVPIGSHEEEAVESLDSSFGLFSRFIFDHLEEDRNRYAQMSEHHFMNKFNVDDILFENFINYAERWPLVQKLNLRYYDMEERIKGYLKAALAAQLFGPDQQARIKAENDPMLQKVLQLDRPSDTPMIRQD
ncbi:S41 family peptidase [Zeaxanthinibacter enoshimensis]|uniref:Carboxyl-terminal processing protease n=1 Tax=Zeaxanthinibacter enoshimensis TaxID=392009 RepID=A0A4R6TRX1_9FLAO|nr:S41 family peptidase [Zeaxanthinibacter enoshimensis]TDQ32629.1 carboxyl-terminal processing protease [Zeaxanthinibacter enoshimensis]